MIGASTDNIEEAQIEQQGLTFPLAYGLNAREFAALTGAFFNEAKGFLHATDFIIRPNGVIEEAVYSTGPIGRFTAADILRLMDIRSQKAAKQKKE